MGAQLLVQLALDLCQTAVDGAAAMGRSPGAGVLGVHAGAYLAVFLHGLHQFVQGGPVQVGRQAAAAGGAADALGQSGSTQLLQDLVGKGLGDQLGLGNFADRVKLSVLKGPQKPQGVVSFPGDQQRDRSFRTYLTSTLYQTG